jgi:uncharacterized phage-associated protein
MAGMDGRSITAQQVADYIIASAHECGAFVSNLKLQKLLYYTQAWYLAIFGKPLFTEKFQAWLHGPAIPDIWRRYNNYRWMNIDEAATAPEFSDELSQFMKELMDEYLPLDASKLEQMTHREDPWIIARGGIPMDQPSNNVIDEGIMRDYYRARLQG